MPIAIEIAKKKLQNILGTIVSFSINDALYFSIPEIIEINQFVVIYLRFIQKIQVGGN